MPVLWTFSLNAPVQFKEAEYLFEFEGVTYRLIRGTKTESDKILTFTKETNEQAMDKCIERTSRLINYLSWQFGYGIESLGVTGHGCSKMDQKLLEKANVPSFHARILKNILTGISHIPDVSDEVQDLALSLWNEAKCSRSPFLSFINFWRIIQLVPQKTKIKGSPDNKAIEWINKLQTRRIYGLKEFKENIKHKHKYKEDVGTYLYEECRNAIAHVTRKPTLKRNNIQDTRKINEASEVMEPIAKYYIYNELNLSPYPKELNVIKTKKRTRAFQLLKQLEKNF